MKIKIIDHGEKPPSWLRYQLPNGDFIPFGTFDSDHDVVDYFQEAGLFEIVKPGEIPESDYDCSSNAHRIVSEANMDSKESLLKAAEDIEKTASTGYYDDEEGCQLMLKIAEYYRKKAN